MIYYRLRGLRDRGKLGHYLTWAVAVGLSVALITLPETVANGWWRQYILIVVIAIASGLGFAWYARRWQGQEC